MDQISTEFICYLSIALQALVRYNFAFGHLR